MYWLFICHFSTLLHIKYNVHMYIKKIDIFLQFLKCGKMAPKCRCDVTFLKCYFNGYEGLGQIAYTQIWNDKAYLCLQIPQYDIWIQKLAIWLLVDVLKRTCRPDKHWRHGDVKTFRQSRDAMDLKWSFLFINSTYDLKYTCINFLCTKLYTKIL